MFLAVRIRAACSYFKGIVRLMNNSIGSLVSYHVHTQWSDGADSSGMMVKAAKDAGLLEVGVSDHFTMHPSEVIPWSMHLDKLRDYVEEITIVAGQSDIPVRLGLEADFFPQTVQSLSELIEKYPFDYIIGSVHFAGDFPIDESPRLWDSLDENSRNQIWRQYWGLTRLMAESGCFDICGHLDLPKKFGYRATTPLEHEIRMALDSIAEAGMAIEINTAGWSKPVGEAYPSLCLLRNCRERDIPILISADAHNIRRIAWEYPRAVSLAREAGYEGSIRYCGRERFFSPFN